MAAAAPSSAAAAPSGAAASSSPDAKPPERRKKTLRQAVLETEPVTDKILRIFPEFVRDLLQDRRRQLLHVERKMQRRLVNEFRAQVRELEPILEERGRLLGETLLEVFTGEGDGDQAATYGDLAARSLEKTPVGERFPVQDLATTIDPLITPFIDPFVEGIKKPIYAKASEIEQTVVQTVVATGAACLVGGFLGGYVLGRCMPRGGGDGGGRGGARGGGGGGR